MYSPSLDSFPSGTELMGLVTRMKLNSGYDLSG